MITGKYARRWAVALLLGLATFACADDETAGTPPRQQSAAAEPLVRDVWYAYEDDGQRYGFEHVTVEKREDGNFAYRSESKLLLDLLGQRQEVTQSGTFIVTPALEPVSLQQEGKQQSGATRITGHVEAGELVLVYEREGLRRERRIDLAQKPLFPVCLDDWLHGDASATEPLRRQIIDDSSLELNDGVFARKDAEGTPSVWDVDLGPGAGRGTIAFGPDGIRTEVTFRAPKIHLVRVSADEAKQIKHRALQGRELLDFPVDRPIGPVQKLTSLTVRLRWVGTGIEKLRPEDERQKVVERSTQDGEKQLLVRIQPVSEQDLKAAPVEADELRPYLAEDRYIKPHDPKVVEQSRIWKGDAQTPSDVVRALSRGVFTFMQGGSLIVETLSAPEILQCKQGKCSEFAILFASAARSAGIPTRIALGMRMVSGSWVGHMWNEAFVGRWITVDATTDEVGSAPGLLKLVDSDTVDGTQGARWAAADALRVAIEDFAPSPPADAKNKTGIDGSVYTNAEFACRLTAPHADWSIESSPPKGAPATVIRFKVPQRDDVLIHFVPIDVPAAFTPAMLTAARVARFKGMYKEFEVVKDEDYPFQRMKGRLLAFARRGGGSEEAKMKTTEVLWSDGMSCFLLNLIAGEKAHDDYAADFFKLLGSFESLRSEVDK